MSYNIIRSICIDEEKQKVFITSASNNIIPHHFNRNEAPYFDKFLKEGGREAVEIEILHAYETGDFQGGSNKYIKALSVLRNVFAEEYFKFNWQSNWEESKKNLSTEEGKKEFKELLRKALNYKLPKEKFVISKEYSNDGLLVYAKICPTCVKWIYERNKATKFDFEIQAQKFVDNFNEGRFKDVWKVVELNQEKPKLLEVEI